VNDEISYTMELPEQYIALKPPLCNSEPWSPRGYFKAPHFRANNVFYAALRLNECIEIVAELIRAMIRLEHPCVKVHSLMELVRCRRQWHVGTVLAQLGSNQINGFLGRR
jgi:hypothetical protein